MLPHGSQADSSPVARERLVMPNQKPRVVTHRASEETFIFNEEEYNADMEDTDEYDRAAAKLNRYMSDPEAAQKLEILTRQVSMSNWSDWSSSDKRPAGFDFADVLSESVRRMDEEGMESSHTGVSFTNVTTKGLQQGSEFGATASEPLRALQELSSRIKKTINPPLKNIIEGVDGYVEAGEMLMVVGRPGAGCTALLKTLAGEVDQFKGVEGDIEYDGIPFDKMMRNFKSDIIYNSEGKLDAHANWKAIY
jgi:ATP-binding cassette subfamily G (WHITE) protein 2 (SNQ2)